VYSRESQVKTVIQVTWVLQDLAETTEKMEGWECKDLPVWLVLTGQGGRQELQVK
jgi:hypothetical protein